MIERLTHALDALAATPVIDPARPDLAHILDDCADAARLELDSPRKKGGGRGEDVWRVGNDDPH